MKKFLTFILAIMMVTMSANAQKSDSDWTLNTRTWSSNYFSTALYDIAKVLVVDLAFSGNTTDSLWAERLIPTSDLIFPVGMGKQGFAGPTDIYTPYHRAFGNPFKHLGDFGIGLDVSYKPSGSLLGVYVGAFYKSQEVVFKQTKHNIRGHYLQPRTGVVIGGEKTAVEAGVFYDLLTGASGTMPGREKDMLKGGVGLDFGISRSDKKGRTVLQFSMPLHNFFNTDYAGQQGLKRKVGYIMLTRRVAL